MGQRVLKHGSPDACRHDLAVPSSITQLLQASFLYFKLMQLLTIVADLLLILQQKDPDLTSVFQAFIAEG